MPIFNGSSADKGYYLSLTVTETGTDIPNNTSDISWSLRLYCGASYFQGFASTFSVVIDGTTVFNTTNTSVSLPSANSNVLLASGTRVVTHNSDGTKSLTSSASFRVNTIQSYTPQGTLTVSGTFALTTIARATQPTLADNSVPFGTAFSIGITPAAAGFKHTLSYTFGTKSGTIVVKTTSNPYSWTAANDLAEEIQTAVSGWGTITCDTYTSTDAYIGTKSITFTLEIPTSWKPTLAVGDTSFTWANPSNTLSGYTIQNISTLTLALNAGLNSLVSSYYTYISGYQVRFAAYNSGEVSYNNSLGVSKIVGLITVSGTQNAYYKVKDARGNWSAEVQVQIKGTLGTTIYPYGIPSNNGFNVARNITVATTADFQMNFSRSSINGANTWYYQRQRWGGADWQPVDGSNILISGDSITSTLTHSLPYVEATVYQLRVKLTDMFNTVYYEDTLPTSDVPLALTQYGAGIGKIPTGGGTYDLEVGTGGIWSEGDVKIDGTLKGPQRRVTYLNAATNANDIIEEWVLSGATTGSTNFPTSPTLEWWYVQTIQYSDTRRVQVAHSYTRNEIWQRIWGISGGASWSSWVKVYPAITGAIDAETLDGFDTTASGNRWGVIPVVGTDGVMEGGKYLDFHETDADTADYTGRLESSDGVPYWNGAKLQNIEASGSASNQNWIKYSDGTLIKWGVYDITTNIQTAWAGGYISASAFTLTYNTTIPFVGNVSITASSADTTGNGRTSIPFLATVSSTAFVYQLWRGASTTSQIWRISWQAIGRWV